MTSLASPQSNGRQNEGIFKDFAMFLSSSETYETKSQLLEDFITETLLDDPNPSFSEVFLWLFLLQYFKSKGNLRSSTMRKNLIYFLQTGSSAAYAFFPALDFSPYVIHQTEKNFSNIRTIEELLLNGELKKAAVMSNEAEMSSLAFLISGILGPQALKSFSKAYLLSFETDSLLRLVLEIHLEIIPALFEEALSDVSLRKLIIALLSVKSKFSLLMLKKLGDKVLNEKDDVSLAHALFLLSSLQLNFSKRSRMLLVGYDHRQTVTQADLIYTVFKLDKVSKEDIFSLIRTEIVVEVMEMRKELAKMKNSFTLSQSATGSVAGSESGFSLAPSSIRTSKTMNFSSRKESREKSVVAFQPFRLYLARQVMDEGNKQVGQAVVDEVCDKVFKEMDSEKPCFSSQMIDYISSQISSFSEVSSEKKKRLLTRYPSKPKAPKPSLQKSLNFDSFQEIKKRDPLPLPKNNAITDNEDFVFKESIIEKEVVEKVHLISNGLADDGPKESNGNGWTDPFAKPVGKKKSPVKQKEKHVIQEALVDHSVAVEERARTSSITDPFAISRSRRSSSRASNPPVALSRGSSFQSQTLEAIQEPVAMPPQPVSAPPEPLQPIKKPQASPTPKPKEAVQEDSFLTRVRNGLLRRLVPVGDNATAVDKGLGSSLQGYYDENLKRWVFPGEESNAAEPPKPAAPPVLKPAGPSALNQMPPAFNGQQNQNLFRNQGRKRYAQIK